MILRIRGEKNRVRLGGRAFSVVLGGCSVGEVVGCVGVSLVDCFREASGVCREVFCGVRFLL